MVQGISCKLETLCGRSPGPAKLKCSLSGVFRKDLLAPAMDESRCFMGL